MFPPVFFLQDNSRCVLSDSGKLRANEIKRSIYKFLSMCSLQLTLVGDFAIFSNGELVFTNHYANRH